MSESKIEDRMARLFPDQSEAPVAPVVSAATPETPETTEAVFAAPPVAIDPPAPPVAPVAPVIAAPPPPAPSAPPPPASATPPRDPLLYADSLANADLLNAGEATWPLAELSLAIEAQTPFLIGFLGPSGSGASFALRRWRENVETLAAAAARTAGSPFVSNIVVATIDAANVSDDPASAIASAAFAALERDRDGVNYAALADEAAHAGADPLRAATAAAERHDEAVRRLEIERAARDEVEAKRARLTEALLYETPGSRIDGYIRAKRSAIDARLRQFDLAEGDPTLNYRHLVRDFDAAGPAARASVGLRAIWSYRSQFRWLMLAVVAFLLAFALGQARGSAGEGLRGLASFLAPFADWLTAHDAWLAGAEEGLTIIGFVALAINLWRAFAFAGMLLRGQRMLGQDLRDRRRELDLSSARYNQRVATLETQVDVTARHAEAATKRVGGVKRSDRAPGPIFTSGPETPRQAANSFFAQLGRLMSASSPTTTPAPQRLVFAFDNLDALAPAAAGHLLETAHAMLGPGCVGAVACNPAFLARLEGEGDAARRRIEKLFPIIFNVATLVPADSGRFVARLIGSNAVSRSHRHANAGASAIVEPFSASETALLAALAPLAGSSPRAVKRFLNAYRVARASNAPRPVVALMLAIRLGGDRAASAAIREALAGHGSYLPDPAGPPSLAAAFDAARGASGGAIALADAQAALEIASRYSLPG